MLRMHGSENGITTSSVFRRGRRGGKPDGGSIAKPAHLATLVEAAESGSLGRERGVSDVAVRLLVKEPLMVVLPSDHRLAALKAISPQDLVGETFVTVSDTAPVLRVVINDYLKRSGINIRPAHEADHVTMGISLIMSTRGVGLLPCYAQNFLPSSVTSRPLKGGTPTIELVLGYKKSNESPILKPLLSRLDELVARASNKTR